MRYIALLRGINVGGNHKVPMYELQQLFEQMGFTEVSTYINTGNILFDGQNAQASALQRKLEEHFGFTIPTIVLSAKRFLAIANAIPASWTNDRDNQKSDVAFLFTEADTPAIIQQINPRLEIETVIYKPGALLMNVQRKHQSKSSLQALIGTRLYKQMTIRNVNTVRKIAGLLQ